MSCGERRDRGERKVSRRDRRRTKPCNHFVDQEAMKELRKSQGSDIATSGDNRQGRVRDAAIARAKGICEYCGEPRFVTTGDYLYLETHHITPLSEGGHDAIDNVISLCPNDHMLAHFGKERVSVKEKLQNILFEKNSGDA